MLQEVTTLMRVLTIQPTAVRSAARHLHLPCARFLRTYGLMVLWSTATAITNFLLELVVEWLTC